MSQCFREYRKDARVATRQLLAHKKDETLVQSFIDRINATTNDRQVSMIMTEVRNAI